MIAIVDYDCGNIASILNMFKKIGVLDVVLTRDKKALASAQKIILPGVGAFDHGMQNLKKYDLIETLHQKVVEDQIPTLGICLGMQLMTQGSEEGVLPGLGWFDASTIKFRFSEAQRNLKTPHMGWNYVQAIKPNTLLQEKARFYFVHSYFVQCHTAEQAILSCDYGHTFTCGIQKNNIYGVQFHPEKSHRFGMALLKNFSDL